MYFIKRIVKLERFATACAVFCAAVCVVFLFALSGPSFILSRRDLSGQSVALRDFPYPYGAMVALVNDCDNTTLRSFERYHRFINTREPTIYGEGLGLDVSDSFFMYTAAADYNLVMTYFLGADPNSIKDARLIERYIRCGWIDTLHTYGDFSAAPVDGTSSESAAAGASAEPAATATAESAPPVAAGAPAAGAPSLFSRELAVDAYLNLFRDGLFPIVWTDHGNEGNAQNFGSYGIETSAKYKRGDAPNSGAYYHADVTLAGGVKYIWDARRSNRFGSAFPLAARTLRDGRKLWSFGRYTGSGKDGVIWDWYPDRLRGILTEERLSELVTKRQYGMFAQHLGYYGEDYRMDPKDIDALRLLADYQYERNAILVAGTARLLEYATANAFVNYTASISVDSRNDSHGDSLTDSNAETLTDTLADTLDDSLNDSLNDSRVDIDITAIGDPLFPEPSPALDRLRGLTFYCDEPDKARILIRGTPIDEREIARNPPDETGRPSISIKWHEPDATDYTRYG